MVVVGDGKGKVGWGYGKANEVPPSVQKATKQATRDMINVPLVEGSIPHQVWGEQVLALVVLREGNEQPSSRQLIRHCREHLATFKCPARIEVRQQLPRNAAGKLQKRSLRDPFWSDRERLV